MTEPKPTTPEGHEDIEEVDRPGDPSLRESREGRGSRGSEDRETVVQDVNFPEFDDEESTSEPSKINRLLDVRLTLAVELGRREMLLQEVLNLGQGSILDLEKSSSELVDILINGKLLARGEVVVIDESFGVRITSLVDPVDRVKKMGV
jgi:flagellar motor switch protein FliN/FliY